MERSLREESEVDYVMERMTVKSWEGTGFRGQVERLEEDCST